MSLLLRRHLCALELIVAESSPLRHDLVKVQLFAYLAVQCLGLAPFRQALPEQLLRCQLLMVLFLAGRLVERGLEHFGIGTP